MAMMAAAPAGAAAQEEEEDDQTQQAVKTAFSVRLMKFDPPKKVALIKEIKKLLPEMNLVQAKKFVESAPEVLKQDLTQAEAEEIKKALEEVGGSVVIEWEWFFFSCLLRSVFFTEHNRASLTWLWKTCFDFFSSSCTPRTVFLCRVLTVNLLASQYFHVLGLVFIWPLFYKIFFSSKPNESLKHLKLFITLVKTKISWRETNVTVIHCRAILPWHEVLIFSSCHKRWNTKKIRIVKFALLRFSQMSGHCIS